MDDGRSQTTDGRLSEEGLPGPGTLIAEYRITKPIGVGGCGAVFQAFQERLERDLAVKVLLPSAADRFEGLARRFLREIDIVKRLEHPNIVRLYDFGQSDTGLLWMAMELVRGKELGAVLAEPSRPDAARIKNIMLQVLSALAEAHELNIVHRDLKPGNIMLTRKGADEDVVKLLDFGIGKALGEGENSAVHNLTAAHGDAYGTPRYMAPELLLKEDIGPHSDVYSVGLILFECITGTPAVVGDTVYEILAKQLSSELEMPEWLANTQIGQVIARATEKEWEKRYPTALEFHQALRSCSLQDLPLEIGGGQPANAGVVLHTTQTPLTHDTANVTPSPVTDVTPMIPPRPTAPPALPGPPALPQPVAPPPVATARHEAGIATPMPSAVVGDETASDADELRALMGSGARKQNMIYLGIGAAVLLLCIGLMAVFLSGEDASQEASADGTENTTETHEPVERIAEPVDPNALPMVEWAFSSAPGGAEVQVNGRLVCDATPCTAKIRQLDRSVTVIMTLDGYRSVSETIVPAQAGELGVEFQAPLAPDEMLPRPAAPDEDEDEDEVEVEDTPEQDEPDDKKRRRRDR